MGKLRDLSALQWQQQGAPDWGRSCGLVGREEKEGTSINRLIRTFGTSLAVSGNTLPSSQRLPWFHPHQGTNNHMLCSVAKKEKIIYLKKDFFWLCLPVYSFLSHLLSCDTPRPLSPPCLPFFLWQQSKSLSISSQTPKILHASTSPRVTSSPHSTLNNNMLSLKIKNGEEE